MSIKKASGKWIHGPLTVSGQRLLGISPSVLGYADEKDDGAVFLYDGHYYIQENGKAWLETDIDESTLNMLATTSKMQLESEHYLWVPIQSNWKCQSRRTLVFTSLAVDVSELKDIDDWRSSSIDIHRLDDEHGTLSSQGDILSKLTHSPDENGTEHLLSIPAKLMGNREIAIHPKVNKPSDVMKVVASTNVHVMRHAAIDRCVVYRESNNWKLVVWGNRDTEDIQHLLSTLITPTFNEWKARCWFDQTDVELLHYYVSQ